MESREGSELNNPENIQAWWRKATIRFVPIFLAFLSCAAIGASMSDLVSALVRGNEHSSYPHVDVDMNTSCARYERLAKVHCIIILTNHSESNRPFQWTGSSTPTGVVFNTSSGSIAPGAFVIITADIPTSLCPASLQFTDHKEATTVTLDGQYACPTLALHDGWGDGAELVVAGEELAGDGARLGSVREDSGVGLATRA